jgi:hypothetical protein
VEWLIAERPGKVRALKKRNRSPGPYWQAALKSLSRG